MKINTVGRTISFASVRWLEKKLGSTFLAIVWTLNNPFGDEPTLD